MGLKAPNSKAQGAALGTLAKLELFKAQRAGTRLQVQP